MSQINFNFATKLYDKIGLPLAKLLLKTYLGAPGEIVVGGLLDIAKEKIGTVSQQREAERLFESIGDKIVEELLPTIEKNMAAIDDYVNITEKEKFRILNRVTNELSLTLNSAVSAQLLIEKDLEPTHIEAEIKELSNAFSIDLSYEEEALYNFALSDVVRYLVNIVDTLPGFDVQMATASLKRLSRIQSELESIINQVNRILTDTNKLVSKKPDFRYESDYRQSVIRNLDYLEILGVNVEPESRRNRLSVGYVSLNLNQKTSARKQSDIIPAENLFTYMHNHAERLLVRGEAGSGKSTLFRWIAISSAQDFRGTENLNAAKTYNYILREKSNETRILNRIPFLIRLRDFSGGLLPTPEEFPVHIAKELGNPPKTWVTNILKQGRALVLLDGVDEVPGMRRDRLKMEISALLGAYPNNLFIVSTRPSAVPEDWLKDERFSEAHINPMSQYDREYFIDCWHKAVSSELELQGKSLDLTELAAELKSKLPENPQISRLASNPLLCAAICALHRDRAKKLPHNQSDLCEALCQMLLHRREEESGIDEVTQDNPYAKLHYDQKRSLIQNIAYHMVLNEESVLDYENVIANVGQQLDRFPGRDQNEAREITRVLIERSGLLRESRPGKIDFIHNTFKEYLAADRFVQDNSVGILYSKCLDPAWQPVILFSAASRNHSFASELISKMLAHANGSDTKGQLIQLDDSLKDKELRRYILLAIRCRAAALHLDSKVDQQIKEIQNAFFPPQSHMDAVALADCGDDVVSLLKCDSEMDENSVKFCVETLRMIGTKEAFSFLIGYRNDLRLSVVTELVQVINPLDIKYIQNHIESYKPIPEFSRRYITDISPIAKLENLTKINLSDTNVKHLSPLKALDKLKCLKLAGTQIRSIDFLLTNTEIRNLDISRTLIKSLYPLSNMKNLKILNAKLSDVDDISALSSNKNLESINLAGTKVSNINPLSSCENLVNIDLSNTKVHNLVGLLNCNKLETIDISRTQVIDVMPLTKLPNLRKVNIAGLEVSGESQLAKLLTQRWSSSTASTIEKSDVGVI